MRLRFPAVFFREGHVIVSLCPVLNVSSFGETQEESGYRQENGTWIAPIFIAMREPEVAVA